MFEKPGRESWGDSDDESSSNIFDAADAALEASRQRRSKTESASAGNWEHRRTIVENLLKVSALINSTTRLEELLERIIDSVIEVTGCSRGYLMLAEGGKDLSVAMARTAKHEALAVKNFDVSLSVIRRAASTGEPQYVTNAQEEDELREQRSIVDFDIRTVFCIPLKFEGKLVGVIYADSDSVAERIGPDDLSLLNAFGAHAAVAIENARQRGELEGIRKSLERQNIDLKHQLAGRYEYPGIIGRGEMMQKVFEVISKVAPLSTTVLVQGETGTGKELIARAIHYNSNRKGKAMVSINCGALPKHILESELFGYRKGAFTGADEDRGGLFEAANGSTLFLDEIGEMPLELQVKLLRTLQDGEVRRLGTDRAIKVDVRIVAATNRDLASEVEKGNFRNDLYYRLNVIPITLPPLRERQEDILALAEHFVEKFSKQMNKPKPLLTRRAKELLLNHSWIGNVRELENAIERALALGEGSDSIDVEQFEHLIGRKSDVEPNGGYTPLKMMLALWEKEYIRKMLIRNSWNVSRTATTLKISRQQLHNKIKKHDLHPDI
jgi:transcriptional regulator with GAF, ATPase, and Fis domain